MTIQKKNNDYCLRPFIFIIKTKYPRLASLRKKRSLFSLPFWRFLGPTPDHGVFYDRVLRGPSMLSGLRDGELEDFSFCGDPCPQQAGVLPLSYVFLAFSQEIPGCSHNLMALSNADSVLKSHLHTVSVWFPLSSLTSSNPQEV